MTSRFRFYEPTPVGQMTYCIESTQDRLATIAAGIKEANERVYELETERRKLEGQMTAFREALKLLQESSAAKAVA